MRPMRKSEDLSFEPTLRETLADPVIRAVMARDRVSEDDILRLVLAARARLRLSPDSPGRETNVTPFPIRGARAGDHSREPSAAENGAAEIRHPDLRPPELRPADLRPRTRWPFCLRQSAARSTVEE